MDKVLVADDRQHSPRLRNHRDYSIASLVISEEIELLVRSCTAPDGEPEIGSGWLNHIEPISGTIELRIRARPFAAEMDRSVADGTEEWIDLAFCTRPTVDAIYTTSILSGPESMTRV